MEITLIKAALSYGCDRPGCEEAPDALERHGLFSRVEGFGHRIRSVSVSQRPLDADSRYRDSGSVKWAGEILDVTNRICEEASAAFEQGRLPFMVGGDHSASLGSVKAAANRFERLGVIWFDAHADINSYDTSLTGNYVGMTLSSLIGQGDSRFQDNMYRFVDPRNIVLVGTRSLDEPETEIIRRHRVNRVSAGMAAGAGDSAGAESRSLARILGVIRRRRIERLHLSIDIDVLDPAFAPAVSVPVPGGLSTDDLYGILRCLMATGLVCSVDLVGYNPRLDSDGLTLASIEALMYALWG